MKNVALAGLGPHAKRIHMNYFKHHRVNLALVIEVASKKEETRKYLDNMGFKNTFIYALPDSQKYNIHLEKLQSEKLLNIVKNLNITHFIISTEPKAHYMYLEFCLKNDINVLTDKPITVNKNMTSLKSIEETRNQYYELLKLAQNAKCSCKVMCQRQYHKGYEEVKKVLASTINKYKVPITNIDIFYSDGAWEMPHDLEKENHPYKYGYGELFHSGYHFIDFLSELLKLNDALGGTKKIERGEVFSKVITPNDEMNILNIEDYKRLFKKQNMPKYYDENTYPSFSNYGEKDYHGLMTFYNKFGFTITTANLNLLHNGISRRSWIETKDFYKSNGRIRHERVDIQIGHLLDIQIHSYQSKEISERTDDETEIGGLEHFDIYFFKNSLIDKEPFKIIRLKDLYSKKEKKNFQGYNELAREEFISAFLNDKNCKGDLKDQALAIEILYACSKGIHNKYAKINRVEPIEVRNAYTYRFPAQRLKNYSRLFSIDSKKIDIKNDVSYKDIYTFYHILYYIPEKKVYEVFFSIDDTKTVAGSLLGKTFKNRTEAYFYFYYLKFLVGYLNMDKLESIIETS